MTRYVFTTDMCAHVWAQQTQDHGNSGKGNVSFRGTTFYSYGTPIANFVTDKNGVRVCLISKDSYSPTTGGHINLAGSAVRDPNAPYGDNPNVYYVKHLGVEGGWAARLYNEPAELRDNFHAANVADMLAGYQDDMKRAKRALKHRYGLEREDFENKIARIRAYAERFDVADVAYPDLDADWREIEACEAARNTPEAIAKREKAQAKRIELARKNYREVTGIYGEDFRSWRDDRGIFTEEDHKAREAKLGSLTAEKIAKARENFRKGEGDYGLGWNPKYWDAYKEHFTPEDDAARDKALAGVRQQHRADFRAVRGQYGEGYRDHPGAAHDTLFTKRDREERAIALAGIEQNRVEAWHNGEPVLPPRHDPAQGALLRVKDSEIQTSWGASFPVEHGRKAFPAVNCCRVKGKEYKRNGHTIHLGHFAIDRVTAEGDVYAGCHFVRWSEIERVAREIGLLPPEGGKVSDAA